MTAFASYLPYSMLLLAGITVYEVFEVALLVRFYYIQNRSINFQLLAFGINWSNHISSQLSTVN